MNLFLDLFLAHSQQHLPPFLSLPHLCVKLIPHSRSSLFATARSWSFGLCATRSREPRQARKGATVSGSPRVPQITRGSLNGQPNRNPENAIRTAPKPIKYEWPIKS